MDRAKVNGVELEYEVRGAGEPVLLIDMLIADCFVPLLPEPALADGYQLIRYHKRGWVGSTHTPPPVSIGRARRRRRGVARAPRCAARSHRGPLHRRVDRSPTGPRPPREGAHAHAAGADAGVVAPRRCVPESRRPGVRGIRKRRPRGRVCHVRGRRKRPRLGRVSSVARGADPGCGHAVDQGCRHLLRSRAARRHRVDVRARAGCRHSQTGPIRDRRGDPAAVGGDRRVPPLLAPARRGVHDRRRGPSPADPASRARRSRRWRSSWGETPWPATSSWSARELRSPARRRHRPQPFQTATARPTTLRCPGPRARAHPCARATCAASHGSFAEVLRRMCARARADPGPPAQSPGRPSRQTPPPASSDSRAAGWRIGDGGVAHGAPARVSQRPARARRADMS